MTIEAEPAPAPCPEISVVVPTFGRAGRLPAIIDAFARQTLEPGRFEVLIVDDCSPDDTVELVRSLAEKVPFRLIACRTPANGGPAVARNVGWRQASAPLLAFVDDDCLAEPGWLASGLAALQASPRPGVVQGYTTHPPGIDLAALDGWWLWRVIEKPGPFLEGCNIFYRRQALEMTGGFDEDIAWWGEDTALGWKVIEAGWPRSFAEGARVIHEVEERGWWWHVTNGYRERNVVGLAARHPGYRAEAFWRPWAFRREDAAFVLALAGVAFGVRFRPALLAAVPYLWWRRPSLRKKRFALRCLQVVTIDAARSAGQLHGALRHRILVV